MDDLGDNEVIKPNHNLQPKEDQDEEILYKCFLGNIQSLIWKLFFMMENWIPMLYWIRYLIWRCCLILKVLLIIGK